MISNETHVNAVTLCTKYTLNTNCCSIFKKQKNKNKKSCKRKKNHIFIYLSHSHANNRKPVGRRRGKETKSFHFIHAMR